MSEDTQPLEIKVSQVKPRAAATPRTQKKVVNVRPAAALASNAAVAGAATMYAVAGATGLWTAGAAIVGGTAATVAKSRAKAKKEAKVAERKSRAAGGGAAKGSGLPGLGGKKATGSAARRAAASQASSARKAGGARRAAGAVGKAAKAAGRALSAPARAGGNVRKAMASGGTGRQTAASAKRRAQVGAALAGKKPNKMRGTGSALMGGTAGRVRDAWKKSGIAAKKKKAADLKRQKVEAAKKKTPAKKYGRTVRGNPNAPTVKATPDAVIQAQSTETTTPITLPAIPLPGATAPAPLATGGNVSTSPMRRMLELAEEMTAIATRWDPKEDGVGMLQVIEEFKIWPEVIRETAKAAKVISDKVEDPQRGLPIHPLALAVVSSVHHNQSSAVGVAEEIPGLITSLHRKQIEVLQETPHHANNDMWGYRVNREAA